jgi:predicted CoA-binding protein
MSVSRRIDDFLSQRRLAMTGVSRNGRDFSRALFREFLRRGYDMVPVHPSAAEIEGRPCARSLREIAPPVDGVLLMTPARLTYSLVEECAAAGIRRVWMYRAVGRGAVDERAVALCEEKGIAVVPGYCPWMFFDGASFLHRLHASLLKLTGAYPR